MLRCNATICCDACQWGLSQPQCTRAFVWSRLLDDLKKTLYLKMPSKAKQVFLNPLVWSNGEEGYVSLLEAQPQRDL